MWTWGRNDYGQLAQNNRTEYSSPVQVPGSTWKQTEVMAIGGNPSPQMSAVKTDGTFWVWGNNGYGQLGQNNLTNYSSPTQIPGTDWNKNVSATYSMKAIKTDGTMWNWGPGGNGALGLNNNTSYSSPTQLTGTTWVDSVSLSQGAMFLKEVR